MPLEESPSRRAAKRWMAALWYTWFLLASLSWALKIWRFFWHRLPDRMTDRLPLWGLGILGLVLVAYAGSKIVRLGKAGVAALMCTGLGYWFLTFRVCEYPAERVHLPTYGLVAWLYFLAFRSHMGPWRATGAALLVGTCVGFVDECIQWALPDRRFGWNDVWLNFLSVALGLCLVRVLLMTRDEQPATATNGD
ncbi:VanZ family protein [Candidatus Hydrogenedentota bacterium]